MNRLLLAGLLPGVMLAACATAPKDAPTFSTGVLPPADPAYAVLVVYRMMVPPLAYKPTVTVNGQEAAELPNDAFTWIKAKPGHVSVKNDWSFASGNPAGAIDMDVEGGHYYYFEITGDRAPAILVPLTIVAHVVSNTASFHSGVQGRGFSAEDETTATGKLVKCCRYVPAEDDYMPADYVPPDGGSH
ncbi:MAG TPA: DUF2846 domain-containing protein [Gammaproteobacteria bacterium]|nr:DUF2846 domain-containing protein [Gammaproteobacteria bacterium]